jgi:hypothetical protein
MTVQILELVEELIRMVYLGIFLGILGIKVNNPANIYGIVINVLAVIDLQEVV